MNKTIRLSALCGCLLAVQAVTAQTVTGRVVDGGGRPLAYANVVAMSLPDSAFVAGVMTADDGSFTLDLKDTGRLLRFSSVGIRRFTPTERPTWARCASRHWRKC